MNELNDTRAQMAEKHRALNNALPVPDYEPDLVYQRKEFTRMPKSGVMAKPNHLGRGLKAVMDTSLPEEF